MISYLEEIKKYNLFLASKSPRRHALMKDMDLDFEVITKDVEEVYPKELPFAEVPEFISKLKAAAFDKSKFGEKDIYITADTIVVIKDKILGKPHNFVDAKNMLKSLSGQMHTVITGVCLTSAHKQYCFSVISDVYFNELNDSDINYYVDKYMPLDKAGAYGIQEWLGFIAIDKIEGSFYNVAGFPTHLLYKELMIL